MRLCCVFGVDGWNNAVSSKVNCSVGRTSDLKRQCILKGGKRDHSRMDETSRQALLHQIMTQVAGTSCQYSLLASTVNQFRILETH